MFIVTGGIGIIWSLIWFKVYQPPRLTKSITKAELDYIRDGGGTVDGDAPVKKEARQPLTRADWKLVFHRKLVGVYLGQFAVTSTLWFFLTVPELSDPGKRDYRAEGGLYDHRTLPCGIFRRPALGLAGGQTGEKRLLTGRCA